MAEGEAGVESHLPLEERKLKALRDFLDLYGEVLDAYQFSYNDKTLGAVIESVKADIDLGEADPQSISIETKKERPEDKERLEKGEDLGVWIEVIHGRKRININFWGGFRESGHTQDYRDSAKNTLAGKGHAETTASAISQRTVIDVNVTDAGQLSSITHLDLDRRNGSVVLKNLHVDGRYTSSDLKYGTRLKTSEQSVIRGFDPLLKNIMAIRDEIEAPRS